MPGAYVPPHLRNRPAVPASSSTPSASSSSSSDPATRRPQSSDRAAAPSQSRTPWSRATPASSSRDTSHAEPWPTYDMPSSNTGRTTSGPGHARAAVPSSSSPSLYVFGDSFVGPMKLLSNDCARKQTYKGASAKGLNNPNSAKQVAKLLLPALEELLVPPPYRYMPSGGRWTLLIFGNVDLQINYLWQLQHKPISHLSFASSSETSKADSTSPDETSDTEEDEHSPTVKRTVLARATETSLTGPALGPELFVQAVAKAYTSFLEREIVNGPIGERLRESAARRRAIRSGEVTGKLPPPGKVLIAAALPPLVEDEVLPRIPEKYVERLEDDHEKAQKALDNTGRNWQEFKLARETEGIEAGVSTLGMTDRPVTPISGHSRSSQGTDNSDPSTANTSLESSSSSPSSPSSPKSKTSIESLLTHDPPLCTIPVRISMTNTYNSIISDFCALHPDVLSFLDISPKMMAIDAKSGWAKGEPGSVDRGTWACPVDPTNVHPLWEPTLPLWLEAMKEEGLPVEGYQVEEGEEDTFKAYEEDKKRRTKARRPEWEQWERDRKEGKVRDE